MDPHESTFRVYVEGTGSPGEELEVHDHMKECDDCREFVDFVRDLSEGIKKVSEEAIGLDDAHPSSPTLVAYEEGTLDPQTSLHLRAHMLFCDLCAESYYLLKRMRAPSWSKVVIEAVRSAKEWLLRPLEVIGMGELVPLAATTTRGGTGEPQSTVEISQPIFDSGGQTDLHLYVEADGGQPGATVRLLAAIASPKTAWQARLLDADENELASIPLSDEKQLLHSSLAAGTFITEVLSNDKVVAECRLQIR